MRWVRTFLHHTRRIFYLLLALLVLHMLTRLVFVVFNLHHFPDLDLQEAWLIFYRGLQQDVTSIIFINFPVIMLLLLGNNISDKKRFRRIALWLFVVINSLGFAINIIDIGYFNFSRHRTNLELWYIFADSLTAMEAVTYRYWFLLLYFLLLVVSLVRLFPRIYSTNAYRKLPSSVILVNQSVVLLLLLVLSRGLAERPVLPSTPLLSVKPQYLPAAQNSIFTLIYSAIREQKEIAPYSFYPEAELDRLVPVVQRMAKGHGRMKKKNVVLFILESFSRNYLLPGHPLKAKTPFLDSLIRHSLFFPNTFANNYTSTQGIVSILGSIPTLLDEPFFYSAYANFRIQGIGAALKEKGYDTNFFMGAGEDHFGFGKFAKMVGIDNYYSRQDFDDDRFDDGAWGIFDEPFFQYGNRVLREKEQPFLAVFFNLSSHYPFTLPPQHRQRFSGLNRYPSQNSISYVDFALQQFFASARTSGWFNNTVFVFCADHWFPASDEIGYNEINASAIPLFIYDPAAKAGSTVPTLASQLDVVPTILDLLQYDGTYYGFGKSLLDTGRRAYVVNPYQNHYFQCISEDLVLGYDPVDDTTRYLYRYRGDSLISGNLAGMAEFDSVAGEMEKYTKAYLQRFNEVMINRKFQ